MDPERALPVLSEWRRYFKYVDIRSREDMISLEDYVTYRTMNVAWQ